MADSGSEMMRRKQVQTGEVEGEFGEKHRNGGRTEHPRTQALKESETRVGENGKVGTVERRLLR